MFEWDPRKAQANAAKHGVSFEDAVTVFLDPKALDGPDLQHSSVESRFLRLGRSVRYLPSDVDDFVRASAVDTRSESSSDGDSELGELHV